MLKYILSALIIASCVVGCVKYDEIDPVIAPDMEGDGSQISFVIPTMDDVEITRADGDVAGVDEYAIHNGYLFVFDSKGAYKGKMEITSGKITDWALDTEDNTYNFKIDATDAEYNTGDNIVCVFNYDESKTPSLDNISSVDDINEQFPLDETYLAAVTAVLNNETYELGMPMAVNDFEGNSSVAYHEVYRALARLEVYVKAGMSTDASATSHSHEFNAENTKYAVVNSVNSGTICPSATEHKSSGTAVDFDNLSFNHSFTTANITTSDVDIDEYGHSDETTESQLVSNPENRVYLFPYNYSTNFFDGTTDNDATTYKNHRFALLLKHAAAEGHNHGDQYYKLNLMDKVNGNKYYDLKRNHSYRVIITKVHSNGYDSALEAYDMPPSNIDYEIYDDQGDATLSNGQYAISMDEVVNYSQIDIYGHDETVVSFENISYVMPKEMNGMSEEDFANLTNKVIVSYEYAKDQYGEPKPGTTEIPAATNPISVTVDNPFDEDSTPDSYDYTSTGKLTKDPQDLKFTVKGTGTCTIGLEIQLGNLKTGVGTITINKSGSGGEGALDAHPIQLRYENREYVEGSWQSASPSNDFGARIATQYDIDEANKYNTSSDDMKDISMVLFMGHNATPIGFHSMDGSYTSSAAEDSYPIFAEKTREGYYDYIDTSDPDEAKHKKVTTKVMATQLAPYYIGHFGRENDGTSTHHYKAVIVERIEEIPGGIDYLSWDDESKNEASIKNGSSSRGTIQWSSTLNQFYSGTIWGDVNGMKRYKNFVEGLDICNNIATNPSVNKNATAVMYCYMKNDVDGDGEIEDNEPIEWYLPAQNQMVGFWVSKKQFDEDHNSRGTYYLNEANVTEYWTCSEVDQNQWGIPSTFLYNVLPLDMMEGESIISTKKTEQAHVRCMRGVDSY